MFTYCTTFLASFKLAAAPERGVLGGPTHCGHGYFVPNHKVLFSAVWSVARFFAIVRLLHTTSFTAIYPSP